MKIIATIATTTCNDNYNDHGNGRTENNGEYKEKEIRLIHFCINFDYHKRSFFSSVVLLQHGRSHILNQFLSQTVYHTKYKAVGNILIRG